MKSLTVLAFNSYIENGIVGAAKLCVPPHVIAERLHTLRQLAPTRERQVRALYRGWAYECLGIDYEQLDLADLDYGWGFEIDRPKDQRGVAAEDDAWPADVDTRAEANPSSKFCTQAKHGLHRSWEFHKGDADPHPSVPHGHARQNTRPRKNLKLDAYRGFVYDDSGEQVDREPRSAIGALWNDPKFRIFAHEALQHAMNETKHLAQLMLDERGIRYPFRLPGR